MPCARVNYRAESPLDDTHLALDVRLAPCVVYVAHAVAVACSVAVAVVIAIGSRPPPFPARRGAVGRARPRSLNWNDLFCRRSVASANIARARLAPNVAAAETAANQARF